MHIFLYNSPHMQLPPPPPSTPLTLPTHLVCTYFLIYFICVTLQLYWTKKQTLVFKRIHILTQTHKCKSHTQARTQICASKYVYCIISLNVLLLLLFHYFLFVHLFLFLHILMCLSM